MARTTPTIATLVAPIDAYVTTERQAGYFQHALTENLDSTLATVKVVTGCTLVSGGQIQGLNVTVTLSSSSSLGTTACPIYAKLDLGTADRSVSGRASVIEGRLDIGDGESVLSTMSVLCLDFQNLNTFQSITNVAASYIALRERSVVVGSMVNNLFNFMDHTAVTDSYSGLIATSGEVTQTHAIRCLFNGTVLWIKAHTGVPAGGA